MMNTAAIPNPPRRVIVHHRWGGTKDIMAVIMAVVDNEALTAQVATFAEAYRGAGPEQQKEGLRRLWQTCRTQIKYQEDANGTQAIKHPARTWAEKQADCKSLTVFIYHVCRALDVPCFIRFSSYDESKQIGHVYPVAVLDGVAVPVDAVWHRFDDEKRPTYFENHLPGVFAQDAEMLRAVKTSKPNNSAIGNIDCWWHRLKDWQKALAVCIGSAVAYKIIE